MFPEMQLGGALHAIIRSQTSYEGVLLQVLRPPARRSYNMLIALGSKCVLLADLLRGGLNYILVAS